MIGKSHKLTATLSSIETIEVRKNTLALYTCILLLLVTLTMIIKIVYSYCYYGFSIEPVPRVDVDEEQSAQMKENEEK